MFTFQYQKCYIRTSTQCCRNLDIRIALSSGPACSEEDRAKMTEFASEITKGMTVKWVHG